jgi:tetratricopeptide (TPR) repeat protein
MKAFSVTIQSSFAIAALVVAGLGSLSASAADNEAAGRRHAAKANQLAAKNKCKGAVPEFTKAYKSLKDPTILFNRAECQRKLGNDADALKDYEQFLADMPTAPNRASVEARMTSMREAAKAEPPAAPATPATTGSNQPVLEKTKQADKAPEVPVHRAEKWAD